VTKPSDPPIELEASPTVAALLLAIDPLGLGGAALHGPACELRDAWVQALASYLDTTAPVRRLPASVTDERLIGGLDLTATLAAGRPVTERGVLAAAHGGLLVAPMAERISAHRAAQIMSAMDRGRIGANDDPAQFCAVFLDESRDDEDALAAGLSDRVAFQIDVAALKRGEAGAQSLQNPLQNSLQNSWRDDVVNAQRALAQITISDEAIEAITSAALAFGVVSLRAPLFAVRAARAAAALAGRTAVIEADIALSAKLVLIPRATQMPAPPDDNQADEPETAPETAPEPDRQQPPPQSSDQRDDEPPSEETTPPNSEQPDALDDRIVEAMKVALPDAIRAAMQIPTLAKKSKGSIGRSDNRQKSVTRGRPTGTRRGDLASGQKLHLLETLRTAAPWQTIRRAQQPDGPRILVRRDDFRVKRFENRVQNTTLFLVDASGSQALNRLAEAKGAVETLLADSYVRRDQVALISFRGKTPDLLLPPTRSLARAKRALARLPGGGATPLAAALDMAAGLADTVRRRSASPTLVLLTDGGANISRDGSPGRPNAEREALDAARAIAATRLSSLVIDTSPRASAFASKVAQSMQARYIALPYANAAMVTAAVKAAQA
jgi:magnesium chelatase subunit D